MDQQKSGLLSSLSLGRVSRSHRMPPATDTIAHPLLGASTSSLNLPGDVINTSSPGANSNPDPNSISPLQQGRSLSSSKVLDPSSLPYKPRQRHGGHERSYSGSGNAADALASSTTTPSSTTTLPSSPAAPVGVSAAPTTSTSTSTTFAIPPSTIQTSSSQLDPFSSQASPSSLATSRLQLQSLKAAVQQIGLGNGSMGMGMIDAIYEKGQLGRAKVGDGGDWGDLLRVLTSGKAIIFLPSSPASSLPMTPQTLRDHIAFLSPPLASPDNLTPYSVVVTLSGLVGTLQNNQIAFESTVPVDSPLVAALREGTNRSGALSNLRPTHVVSSPPAYPLSADTAILSFPPLGKGSASTTTSFEGKPERKEKDTSTKLGRINPFAFFGSSSHAQYASSNHIEEQSSTTQTPSPRPSLLSLDQETASIHSDLTTSQGDGYQVTAYSITRPIRYVDVHKQLVKALRTSVRNELESLPDKVVERVSKLVLASVCPISSGAVDTNVLKSHHGAVETDEPLQFSNPSECGLYLQNFMETVYDDIISYYRSEAPGGLKRKSSGTAPWSRIAPLDDMSAKHDNQASRQQREELAEHEASEGTERVEGLICRLLYNRIFSPLDSDDSRHDEVLASRIAALNMLDLSLDHLGLITRPEKEDKKGSLSAGLSLLVKNVGSELQRLSYSRCLTPKEKADVLVKAHKIIIDGLAKLPPVKLRPEGELYVPPPAEEEEQEPQESNVELNPLSTITETSERTPLAQGNNPDPRIPNLVLPDSATPQSQPSEAQIEEALTSSVHTMSTSHTETPEPKEGMSGATSGADLLLPIMIYSVVKSNPAQLASQLRYLQRYRAPICLMGEASYAMVNLTAVVEFLEHVQLSDLGLGDESDRVISVEDLTPIRLDILDDENEDTASIASANSRLKGRVFQVGELAAGSANKVITGVVDSSLLALRGFIGSGAEAGDTEGGASVPSPRPGMRPRQASTFSLASVTASVAGIAAAATTAAARTRSRASSRASEQVWGGNQEMIDVSSRPASVRERDPVVGEFSDDEEGSDNDSGNEKGDEEEEQHSRTRGGSIGRQRAKSDARSIISVSSVLSRDRRGDDAKSERVSIGDRLATIGVLGRITHPVGAELPAMSSPMDSSSSKPGLLNNLTTRSVSGTHGRRASLLGGSSNSPAGSTLSLPVSPTPIEPIEPPIERFLTCEVGDIRLHEVGTLLRDYRRLAAIVSKLPQQHNPSSQP